VLPREPLPANSLVHSRLPDDSDSLALTPSVTVPDGVGDRVGVPLGVAVLDGVDACAPM
jgi:hypothetical protein